MNHAAQPLIHLDSVSKVFYTDDEERSVERDARLQLFGPVEGVSSGSQLRVYRRVDLAVVGAYDGPDAPPRPRSGGCLQSLAPVVLI